MNHLFRFPHGLGDAVQFSVVLAHLREFRPEWTIDVQARVGAHSLFDGLARNSFLLDESVNLANYDSVQEIPWPECWNNFADSPSTKAERSLRETFGIPPVERLCRYQVRPNALAMQRAHEYLSRLTGGKPSANGRFNVALIHYQGNSARRNKNLDEGDIRALIVELLALGIRPLLIDFDRRSGLAQSIGCHAHAPIDLGCHNRSRVGMKRTHTISPSPRETALAGTIDNVANDKTLWNGSETGDGGALAALIAQSRLFVGIDSGPGHIAGATDTPTIIVWRRHHPLHFYGLSPKVTHLVPHDHALFLRGDRAEGQRYFTSRYNSRVYRDLKHALPRLANELIVGGVAEADGNAKDQSISVGDASYRQNSLLLDHDHWLREEHRAADAAVVREVYLDDCYRCGELTCRPRTIVDVGAHIGSFARRTHLQYPRASIVCIEANPANLAALRANVGDFATVTPAACCYQHEPQQLLSTVFPGSTNTGASRITPRGNWSWDQQTYRAAGDVPTVTLEQIQAEQNWKRIDLLKLDCEGSEFSILEGCDLSRIGMIVGEFHGRDQFERLVRRRFHDWRVRIFQAGEPRSRTCESSEGSRSRTRESSVLGENVGSLMASSASGASEIGLFWLTPPGSSRTAAGDKPSKDFQARWNICNDCDQLHAACCTMTGLNARRQARRPDGRCPMERWPGQAGHAVPGNTGDSASDERDAHAQLRNFLASRAAGGRLLLRFPHGLGDHVQLTSVLLHLRQRYPQLMIDIACRAGAETMLPGLCRLAIRLGQEQAGEYDHATNLRWPEPNVAYADSPSTKAERCLREVFEIQPLPTLCRYEIARDAAAEERARAFFERNAETWFSTVGCRGSKRSAVPRVVLFHTQGRCGRRLKDLDDRVVAAALQSVREAGCLPIVLDWSRGNKFARAGLAIDAANEDALWETPGQGDGATLAALARRAALCVGIDSGPGHVFAATDTTTIIVWKLLHPVNYFAPTDNVTHWVPSSHGRFIRGRRHVGEAFFAQHYRRKVYGDLERELAEEVAQRLREGVTG